MGSQESDTTGDFPFTLEWVIHTAKRSQGSVDCWAMRSRRSLDPRAGGAVLLGQSRVVTLLSLSIWTTGSWGGVAFGMAFLLYIDKGLLGAAQVAAGAHLAPRCDPSCSGPTGSHWTTHSGYSLWAVIWHLSLELSGLEDSGGRGPGGQTPPLVSPEPRSCSFLDLTYDP